MDLQTAVAASMLPASRSAIAAAFKAHHRASGTGAAYLEFLWAAAGRRDALSPADAEQLLERAGAAVEQGRRSGIQPILLNDPNYPALLGCIPDPPPVLWVRGTLEALTPRAVAIVGSRAASAYALQVAGRLAAEVAGRGIVVVSGLARGVDSAAHRGCLHGGGSTVAVLGSGVDRIYPAEHAALADEITRASGALLAELAPGAPPLPEHFPLRNRIISGITLATVVVEASERSGSLITARYALEQGRDVMAVPGSVLTGRNRGSHGLLKDGAKVVEAADDILQELGWTSAVAPERPRRRPSDPVLARMEPGDAYELDHLIALTGYDGVRLLARLTELELDGLVATSGGRFVRCG